LKTDNSYFKEKVQLRIDSLPGKNEIFVLDCFSGTGRIWNEVKERTQKNINTLSIEKESGKNKTALVGSNLKYLNVLDLNKFDIIDLDAYGIPYAQLNIIFKRKYKGIIHVTAIQSGMGQLPKGMIQELGYSKEMIMKIHSIFNTKGIEKLKNYLYLHGVQSVEGYFIDRKNYFYFNLNSKL
jgi:hypothetical protein